MTSKTPTIAIITATIGRPSLHRAIKSVQAQSYPCRHYVFVDGEQYHAQAKEILKDYPEVIAIYLPMNTGANKMYNSYINAIAPFLANEEIICYLDDDNWYDKDHVKYIANCIIKHNADYAYSPRYYTNEHAEIICEDNFDSLGFWKIDKVESAVKITLRGHTVQYNTISTNKRSFDLLIDVNCFAIKRKLAQALATTWASQGEGADVQVTKYLITNHLIGVCTGKRTVYYQTNLKDRVYFFGFENLYPFELTEEEQYLTNYNNFIAHHHTVKEQMTGGMPWEKETLFKDGQLIVIE